MLLSDALLDRYFQRIGFTATPRRDEDTLRALHALQPLAIPFENLDSWLGRPVNLEPDTVFRKLVVQGRGGYCFEQNLLFRTVLESLGFTVRGLAARVLWNLPEEQVLPRTHKLLLVRIGEQDWIADVGFGGLTMTAPLLLADGMQATPHETLRLVRSADTPLRLEVELGGRWQPLYQFSLETQTASDYAMANWYVSTHPESRFIHHLIAGRADRDFRHALLDRRYTRHYLDGRHEQRVLASPAELRALLESELRIDVDALPELDARLSQLFGEPIG